MHPSTSTMSCSDKLSLQVAVSVSLQQLAESEAKLLAKLPHTAVDLPRLLVLHIPCDAAGALLGGRWRVGIDRWVAQICARINIPSHASDTKTRCIACCAQSCLAGSSTANLQGTPGHICRPLKAIRCVKGRV